jgi:aldehyde:ferredoxin oxidoreductase
LITKEDTGGIELTWGNAEAVVRMTEMMARREGFGAVLADGVGKAVERIGKNSKDYAIAIAGQSLAYHEPRMSGALATAMIADANPAHHMDFGFQANMENGLRFGTDPALQTPKLEPMGDWDKKGPMYAIGVKYHMVFNSAGLCALYTLNGGWVPLAELLAGVTGWDLSWTETLQTGHRIATLRQAFNAREGVTPDMFEMPKRIREELLKVGPCAGVKIDFDTLKRVFFEEMGWDLKSGKPFPETLKKLGLEKLIAEHA